MSNKSKGIPTNSALTGKRRLCQSERSGAYFSLTLNLGCVLFRRIQDKIPNVSFFEFVPKRETKNLKMDSLTRQRDLYDGMMYVQSYCFAH